MLALVAATLVAGRVNIVHQVTSDDLRAGPKLAALKGTWKKVVEFQGVKALATFTYDRKADENFLKDARLTGIVPTPEQVPVKLQYDAMHQFKAKQTAYKLTAKSHGAEVVVATPFEEGGPAALVCGRPAVTEVSAAHDLELGGTRASLFASYQLQDKAARLAVDVKAVGPGDLGATVEYDVGAEKPDVQLSYAADVAPRRNVKATVSADGGSLEYMDAAFERSNGAVWIARAAAPFSGEAPKITVRRHWGLDF